MAQGKDRKGPTKFSNNTFEGKNNKKSSRGNTFFEEDEYKSRHSGNNSDGGYYDEAKAVFANRPNISPPIGRNMEPILSSQPDNYNYGSRQSYGGSGSKPPVKKGMKNQKTKLQKLLIKVAVAIGFLIIGTLVFYFGFVKPNDNYDAQMRIGVEHFNQNEFEDAEIAFNKALGFVPKDLDATIGLVDTYIATGRFEESVPLLVEQQALHIEDVRTYDRLITLYILHEVDIAKANEQVLGCLANGLRPENELILEGPSMDPNGGTFNEAISINIAVPEGFTVRYTNDGTTPIAESALYEKPITLRTNQEIVLTAVAFAENGLMTWPNAVAFKVDLQLMYNNQAIDLVGKTSADIMEALGPLFYSSSESNGIHYNTEEETYFFIFSANTFSGGDPNKVPLPAKAKAIGVSMNISQFVLQMPKTISVLELTQGLGIKESKVVESGGNFYLTFEKSSKLYTFALKDKDTASENGTLVVTNK